MQLAPSPGFFAGLVDVTCPPSTVSVAYDHFAGPKDGRIWRYDKREGSGSCQMVGEAKGPIGLWD